MPTYITGGGPFNGATANGISENGTVVGTSSARGAGVFFTHGFVWTSGSGRTLLGTLGGLDTFGNAINNAGQIAGHSATRNAAMHAFLWTAATGMLDIGTLGGTDSYGFGINNAGQIAGYSGTTGDAAIHAFLWTPGSGMHDLGTLGGQTATLLA